MRWYLWLGIAVLLVLMIGCGGGGNDQPIVTDTNRLVVHYLDWLITMPQRAEQDQEFFEVSAKLWMPQDAPLLNTLMLTCPQENLTFPLGGPGIISATDGTNKEGIPIHVYWGVGESLPANQPVQVQPQTILPGYIRPTGDIYIYAGGRELDSAVNVAGVYHAVDNTDFNYQWTIPAGTEMLKPANITLPVSVAVNSKKPITIAWDPVPGAMGYLVNIEGDIKNQEGVKVAHVVWTSATRPIVFEALMDYTKDLLPATVNQVTVPATVFQRCESLQVNVLAHGTPAVDTTVTPTLTINCGSLSTCIFALFEM
ncbi:MAG: hypothetical protein ACYDBB_17625 [Armatimonadota bacterium]